jgi:DNA polymerase-3 subunit beta
MKIRLRRESFLLGCRLAGRGLPRRPVGPGRLLLRAEGTACVLHAVGPEVGLRLEVPAAVDEPGDALLPTREALAVMSRAVADEVTLESAPGRVRALGEGAEFLLEEPGPGAPAALGPFPDGPCHLLPADLLCQAARRTLFAVGARTPRYSLDAVLWEVEADQVRLVATDNRRLAVAEVHAQAGDENAPPVRRLLPARAVDLLARVSERRAEPVEAVFGEGRVSFRAGPATLCARCVGGSFPDWRRAWPGRPRHLLPMPVGPFLAGVRQAAALHERGGRLLLRFQPGWVQMESRRAGAGRARVRLPLPLAGGRVEVALDSRPLIDLLRAFDPGGSLLLGLTDPAAPAVFSDGDCYAHVLMPLRLG